MLFQYPDEQLFTESVENEIAWSLENLGLKREEIQSRVRVILNKFELSGMAHGTSRQKDIEDLVRLSAMVKKAKEHDEKIIMTISDPQIQMRVYLKELGWTARRITESFEEIRNTL